MVPDLEVVNLSRLQFGATALYHFLFVPLTLGLSWILVIMESVYVMTGQRIYRDMTQFWGKLFGINFAMGITTGITLEFQFGTNWAYYSHYVGDIFGVPLAIEGLMAFFLESTFVGLFFFGWKRLSEVQHLSVTFLVALGSNLSALWILIANAWMQNPVGAEFNYATMRMELVSITEIIFNPVAQAKFVHTVAAGYVTASMFVLGISSWYLLKGRDTTFALRSFAVASGFGLASALSVIVLGDESGYTTGESQQVKIAVIEAEWVTQKPPASFMVFGIPDEKTETSRYAIHVPWLLGLIATRSVDTPVLGIAHLRKNAEVRIQNGILAYAALQKLKSANGDAEVKRTFETTKKDLGYGLLLKQFAQRGGRDAGADQTGGGGYDSASHTVVLVIPADGEHRTLAPVGIRVRLLLSRAPQRGAAALATAHRGLQHPATLDCGGTRLDRRRVRPAAMDHQRCAADLSGRLLP